MMEIRSDVSNLFRLTCLLVILFWTLTWNSPENVVSRTFSKLWNGYDVKEVKVLPSQGISPLRSKYSDILDTFKGLSYLRKKFTKEPSTTESFVLLPFNVWKEIELSRQENQDEKQEKPKLRRRKLNYASSKCGAKILASNKEAKFQMSILSEKRDEYMLNPCRANAWFIVELCDAIEATQIELVNYELYSSSPKRFSTFWSDVYPTKTWHHLGTFEAKDQKTIQSFDVDAANLGKFIKVIISSHYGAEHFCPLSVFRTLGFSMVYEYEEIERKTDKKISTDKNYVFPELTNSEKRKNRTPIEEKKMSKKNETTLSKSHSKPLKYLLKACELEKKYCLGTNSSASNEMCLNQPLCIFMRRRFPEIEKVFEQNNSCRRHSPVQNFTALLQKISYSNSNSTLINVPSTLDNGVSSHIDSDGSSHENSNRTEETGEDSAKIPKLNTNKNDLIHSDRHGSDLKEDSFIDEVCKCKKEQLISEELVVNSLDASDSAALIQKESVIFKLTSRIRAAEVNLNLINKYLQQLSQEYREKVKNIRNIFNGTVKALQVASQKAAEIDRQQYLSINILEVKLNSLNKKVDFLTEEYKSNIWKQVLELHGFFLFLEIVILIAVFNIFANELKRYFLPIYSGTSDAEETK